MADKYINIGGHKVTTSKDVQHKHKTIDYGGSVDCYKWGNVVMVTLDNFTTAPPVSSDVNIQIFDSTENDWKPIVRAWNAISFTGGLDNTTMSMASIRTDGVLNFYTYITAAYARATFTYISQG